MKISEWMSKSGVSFGTSGARGLVLAMTDDVCFAYTVGYLRYLHKIGEFSPGGSVAIAGDLRPSTPRIMDACIAAIVYMQGKVIMCGQIPTPALCLYAFKQRIPSLMITGSHIPSDRNGIKFNRICGEFTKEDERGMRDQKVDSDDLAGLGWKYVDVTDHVDVIPDYIKRYEDFFSEKILSGSRLGVYQHSSVGRDVLVTLINALGGEVVPLGRSEVFVPVDTEAVRPDDRRLAQKWAKEFNLDAVLTMDGDADRPLMADENGFWLRGDILGVITSRFLRASAVATPISSNTVLEKIRSFKNIYRTRIGSPFVIGAMIDAAESGLVPSVGYEANGGFMVGTEVVVDGRILPPLPTRDAVLPMLATLVAAKQSGLTLSGLVDTLPPRFTVSDRLADIPTHQSLAKISLLQRAPEQGALTLGFLKVCGDLLHVDSTDGLRMTFVNQEIVHLRPSGNAPELRIYVEAGTLKRADQLLAFTLDAVGTWKE